VKLNTQKTAMTLGICVSLMHFVWLLMVYFGFAQIYLNWIFGLHQVYAPITVLPFNLVNALLLLVITFVAGYALGWVFSLVWNGLIGKK
jgi:hypothetical protein